MPFRSPGHLPNPGIKLASPALAGEFFTKLLEKPLVVVSAFAYIMVSDASEIYKDLKRISLGSLRLST